MSLRIRKAFICDNCDFVYCDEPVTECDCSPGKKPQFTVGEIIYYKPDPEELEAALRKVVEK